MEKTPFKQILLKIQNKSAKAIAEDFKKDNENHQYDEELVRYAIRMKFKHMDYDFAMRKLKGSNF